MAPPNMKGVRWYYADAIASTLTELNPFIAESLDSYNFDKNIYESLVLTAVIKDGGDGMGECSVHKEKGDRRLPDKAFALHFVW